MSERRPELCRVSSEDLECLGCGWKLGCIPDDVCGAVEDDKRRKIERDKADYDLFLKLKARFEPSNESNSRSQPRS